MLDVILQVNQLGVYRGFIDNYENAVEIVQKCMQSDQRFRTLAEVLYSYFFCYLYYLYEGETTKKPLSLVIFIEYDVLQRVRQCQN